MNILGTSSVTLKQCEIWIKNIKTANKLAIENMPILYNAAVERGILPEVLIAQAMVETGYFNFGGVLNASFHNTCGLKTTKGGGDYVANAHMKFSSWKEGIEAHADHLALYAGSPKFPKYSPNTKGYENDKYKVNGTTLDPRHFTYLHGKSKTVEGLSGTWATNKNYAKDLMKLINSIRNTKVVSEPVPKNGPYKNGTYNVKAKITASALNIRAGRPGDKGYNTIYGTYKKGDVVLVKYCLNNWFGVIYKGKQAFISGEYVKLL